MLIYAICFLLFFIVSVSTKYAFVGWTGANSIEITIVIALGFAVINLFMITPLTIQHISFVFLNETTQENMIAAIAENSEKVSKIRKLVLTFRIV